MNNIYGIILGAGEGTRMKSCLPKVLHKVAGKELISHVMDCLNSAVKMQKLVVVVGSGSDLVIEHLKKYNADYAFQKERLGSAHALLQAKNKFKNLDGQLIVMCGDTPLVKSSTIKNLLKHHIKNKNNATVLSGMVQNPFGYGRIVRNSNGAVTCIVEEKSATDEEKNIKEINSGIYCFDLKVLWKELNKVDNKNNKKEYYLTDVIEILNKDGYKTDAVALTTEEEILGVNDRKQLAVAETILRERKNNELMANGVTIVDPKTTYIDSDVVIGKDTIIKPNTFIEGKTKIGEKCIIGPDTTITGSVIKDDVFITYSYIEESEIENDVKIGPFAHIRPKSVLKENVKVGNFSEVKKSIVGFGSKVNHLSYIGDATVGKNVNIGAGTITCNYDGKNKFQTVIGDNVFVGSNVNLVAPVNIGKKVLIAAGSTITDNVSPNKLTIARARQVVKVRKK
jgi:bifunctional UDP-N-acetylglucosamine pyrophosphorylase/glucosamine-1-phosphate N-acetyltransferase